MRLFLCFVFGFVFKTESIYLHKFKYSSLYCESYFIIYAKILWKHMTTYFSGSHVTIKFFWSNPSLNFFISILYFSTASRWLFFRNVKLSYPYYRMLLRFLQTLSLNLAQKILIFLNVLFTKGYSYLNFTCIIFVFNYIYMEQWNVKFSLKVLKYVTCTIQCKLRYEDLRFKTEQRRLGWTESISDYCCNSLPKYLLCKTGRKVSAFS